MCRVITQNVKILSNEESRLLFGSTKNNLFEQLLLFYYFFTTNILKQTIKKMSTKIVIISNIT